MDKSFSNYMEAYLKVSKTEEQQRLLENYEDCIMTFNDAAVFFSNALEEVYQYTEMMTGETVMEVTERLVDVIESLPQELQEQVTKTFEKKEDPIVRLLKGDETHE